MTYFNEHDKFAANWLRNLFPKATVDERDIQQVTAADLTGFRRCHFFGGIGGWEYALKLAGWPAEWPVWTGSCPCQPFSAAGKGKAEADERHLWPEFHRLIAECRPPIIFGEQVASRLGREWLAGVRDDLEALEYEVGAADLCAAGVGAPHRRQRLYWVAHANVPSQNGRPSGGKQPFRDLVRCGHEGLADPQGPRRRMVDSADIGQADREIDALTNAIGGGAEGLGHTPSERLEEQWREYRPSGERCSGLVGLASQAGVPEWNGPTIAVQCSDGPRRVSAQPGTFPLAHGVSKRMGKLRGSGNSIVPQLAAVFIEAAIGAL